MRTPRVARLTDDEWQAQMATNVTAAAMDEEASQQLMNKTRAKHHSCYPWCIVSLAVYTSSELTTNSYYHTLVYLQAAANL